MSFSSIVRPRAGPNDEGGYRPLRPTPQGGGGAGPTPLRFDEPIGAAALKETTESVQNRAMQTLAAAEARGAPEDELTRLRALAGHQATEPNALESIFNVLTLPSDIIRLGFFELGEGGINPTHQDWEDIITLNKQRMIARNQATNPEWGRSGEMRGTDQLERMGWDYIDDPQNVIDWGEKIARFGVATLFDIGEDPVNLFTGGGAGLARKTALEITDNIVTGQVMAASKWVKSLKDDALKVVVTEAAPPGSSPLFIKAAESLQGKARVLSENSQWKGSTIDDLVDEVGGVVDANYLQKGLLKEIQEDTGEELTEEVVEESAEVGADVLSRRTQDAFGNNTTWADMSTHINTIGSRKQFHVNDDLWDAYTQHVLHHDRTPMAAGTIGGLSFQVPFMPKTARSLGDFTASTQGLVSRITRGGGGKRLGVIEKIGTSKPIEQARNWWRKTREVKGNAALVSVLRDPKRSTQQRLVEYTGTYAVVKNEQAVKSLLHGLSNAIGGSRVGRNLVQAIRDVSTDEEIATEITRRVSSAYIKGGETITRETFGDIPGLSITDEMIGKLDGTVKQMRWLQDKADEAMAKWHPEFRMLYENSDRTYTPLKVLDEIDTAVVDNRAHMDEFFYEFDRFRAQEEYAELGDDDAFLEYARHLGRELQIPEMTRGDLVMFIDFLNSFKQVKVATGLTMAGSSEILRLRTLGASARIIEEMTEEGVYRLRSAGDFNDLMLMNDKFTALLNRYLPDYARVDGVFETHPAALFEHWITSAHSALGEYMLAHFTWRTGHLRDVGEKVLNVDRVLNRWARSGVFDDLAYVSNKVMDVLQQFEGGHIPDRVMEHLVESKLINYAEIKVGARQVAVPMSMRNNVTFKQAVNRLNRYLESLGPEGVSTHQKRVTALIAGAQDTYSTAAEVDAYIRKHMNARFNRMKTGMSKPLKHQIEQQFEALEEIFAAAGSKTDELKSLADKKKQALDAIDQQMLDIEHQYGDLAQRVAHNAQEAALNQATNEFVANVRIHPEVQIHPNVKSHRYYSPDEFRQDLDAVTEARATRVQELLEARREAPMEERPLIAAEANELRRIHEKIDDIPLEEIEVLGKVTDAGWVIPPKGKADVWIEHYPGFGGTAYDYREGGGNTPGFVDHLWPEGNKKQKPAEQFAKRLGWTDTGQTIEDWWESSFVEIGKGVWKYQGTNTVPFYVLSTPGAMSDPTLAGELTMLWHQINENVGADKPLKSLRRWGLQATGIHPKVEWRTPQSTLDTIKKIRKGELWAGNAGRANYRSTRRYVPIMEFFEAEMQELAKTRAVTKKIPIEQAVREVKAETSFATWKEGKTGAITGKARFQRRLETMGKPISSYDSRLRVHRNHDMLDESAVIERRVSVTTKQAHARNLELAKTLEIHVPDPSTQFIPDPADPSKLIENPDPVMMPIVPEEMTPEQLVFAIQTYVDNTSDAVLARAIEGSVFDSPNPTVSFEEQVIQYMPVYFSDRSGALGTRFVYDDDYLDWLSMVAQDLGYIKPGVELAGYDFDNASIARLEEMVEQRLDEAIAGPVPERAFPELNGYGKRVYEGGPVGYEEVPMLTKDMRHMIRQAYAQRFGDKLRKVATDQVELFPEEATKRAARVSGEKLTDFDMLRALRHENWHPTSDDITTYSEHISDDLIGETAAVSEILEQFKHDMGGVDVTAVVNEAATQLEIGYQQIARQFRDAGEPGVDEVDNHFWGWLDQHYPGTRKALLAKTTKRQENIATLAGKKLLQKELEVMFPEAQRPPPGRARREWEKKRRNFRSVFFTKALEETPENAWRAFYEQTLGQSVHPAFKPIVDEYEEDLASHAPHALLEKDIIETWYDLGPLKEINDLEISPFIVDGLSRNEGSFRKWAALADPVHGSPHRANSLYAEDTQEKMYQISELFEVAGGEETMTRSDYVRDYVKKLDEADPTNQAMREIEEGEIAFGITEKPKTGQDLVKDQIYGANLKRRPGSLVDSIRGQEYVDLDALELEPWDQRFFPRAYEPIGRNADFDVDEYAMRGADRDERASFAAPMSSPLDPEKPGPEGKGEVLRSKLTGEPLTWEARTGAGQLPTGIDETIADEWGNLQKIGMDPRRMSEELSDIKESEEVIEEGIEPSRYLGYSEKVYAKEAIHKFQLAQAEIAEATKAIGFTPYTYKRVAQGQVYDELIEEVDGLLTALTAADHNWYVRGMAYVGVDMGRAHKAWMSFKATKNPRFLEDSDLRRALAFRLGTTKLALKEEGAALSALNRAALDLPVSQTASYRYGVRRKIGGEYEPVTDQMEIMARSTQRGSTTQAVGAERDFFKWLKNQQQSTRRFKKLKDEALELRIAEDKVARAKAQAEAQRAAEERKVTGVQGELPIELEPTMAAADELTPSEGAPVDPRRVKQYNWYLPDGSEFHAGQIQQVGLDVQGNRQIQIGVVDEQGNIVKRVLDEDEINDAGIDMREAGRAQELVMNATSGPVRKGEKKLSTERMTLEDVEAIVLEAQAAPPPPGKGITKVISGGQIGADQMGLDAGQELGLEVGGTAPRRFIVDDGRGNRVSDPSIGERYGLVEHADDDYPGRTLDNVRDSDATVLFTVPSHKNSGGSKLTRRYAQENGKPLIENPTPEEMRDFVREHNVGVLNVAGNRQYPDPEYIKTIIRAASDVEISPTGVAKVGSVGPSDYGTRVVNVKNEAAEVNIMRNGDLGGRLGNPFTHREDLVARDPSLTLVGSVEEAVERFEDHFMGMVSRGEISQAELASLAGKTLGCVDAPGPCHGDIIARVADQAAEAMGQTKFKESHAFYVGRHSAKEDNVGNPFYVGTVEESDRYRGKLHPFFHRRRKHPATTVQRSYQVPVEGGKATEVRATEIPATEGIWEQVPYQQVESEDEANRLFEIMLHDMLDDPEHGPAARADLVAMLHGKLLFQYASGSKNYQASKILDARVLADTVDWIESGMWDKQRMLSGMAQAPGPWSGRPSNPISRPYVTAKEREVLEGVKAMVDYDAVDELMLRYQRQTAPADIIDAQLQEERLVREIVENPTLLDELFSTEVPAFKQRTERAEYGAEVKQLVERMQPFLDTLGVTHTDELFTNLNVAFEASKQRPVLTVLSQALARTYGPGANLVEIPGPGGTRAFRVDMPGSDQQSFLDSLDTSELNLARGYTAQKPVPLSLTLREIREMGEAEAKGQGHHLAWEVSEIWSELGAKRERLVAEVDRVRGLLEEGANPEADEFVDIAVQAIGETEQTLNTVMKWVDRGWETSLTGNNTYLRRMFKMFKPGDLPSGPNWDNWQAAVAALPEHQRYTAEFVVDTALTADLHPTFDDFLTYWHNQKGSSARVSDSLKGMLRLAYEDAESDPMLWQQALTMKPIEKRLRALWLDVAQLADIHPKRQPGSPFTELEDKIGVFPKNAAAGPLGADVMQAFNRENMVTLNAAIGDVLDMMSGQPVFHQLANAGGLGMTAADLTDMRTLRDKMKLLATDWQPLEPGVAGDFYGLGGIEDRIINPTVGAELMRALGRMQLAADPRIGMEILAAGQKVSAWWTKAATVARPTFHMRNLIGGLWNNMIIGVNPVKALALMPDVWTYVRNRRTAGDIAMEGTLDDLLEAYLLDGISPENMDLFSRAIKAGVMDSAFSSTLPRNMRTAYGWKAWAPWNPDNKFFNAGGEAMEFVEGILRMSAFEKYYDPDFPALSTELARTMTNMVHFDYQDLSAIDQRIKAFVPFWVWTSRNLPLQMRQLLGNPKMILRYEYARRNWNYNMTAGEEESNKWLGEGQRWVLPFRREDNEGNWLQMSWEPALPFTDILETPAFKQQFADGGPTGVLGDQALSMGAWFAWASGSFAPQYSAISDVSVDRKDQYNTINAMPIFNEIFRTLNVGETTPQGDVRVSPWWNRAVQTAVPFWTEYSELVGLSSNSPYSAGNQGFLPDEYMGQSGWDPRVIPQRLGRGFGLNWRSPEDLYWIQKDYEAFVEQRYTMERAFASGEITPE